MFGNHEPITFQRDCEAVRVPAGESVTLPVGAFGYLTQALGGSFTVYISGNLFRIDGSDADAIGKKPQEPPEIPDNPSDRDIEAVVLKQLKSCYDPEIPINIVDLGLIYDYTLNKGDNSWTVDVTMTLTAPGCGMGEFLVQDVKHKLELVPVIDRADVELVFDPPWNQSMMSEEARLQTGLMY